MRQNTRLRGEIRCDNNLLEWSGRIAASESRNVEEQFGP